MFVVRIGSQISVQLNTENMPPFKKLKTMKSSCEDGKASQSGAPSESDQDYGINWREKCKTLHSRSSYALRKNILSDVTFIVGPESTVCHGHRLILALGSPVFDAMFYGALAEKDNTITIPDVDPEGFQNLLEFLYSDEICLKCEVVAFKTYFVADKYCVTGLKEHCEKYLCDVCILTPSNVWIFLENSHFLNSQAIKDRCLNYLRYNADSALKDSRFLDVNAKTIEILLGLDDLKISEVNKLKNVFQWAEYKSELETADSFQNILKPLMQYVRFDSLTSCEFVNLRTSSKLKELLTEQDALAILEHLINPLDCVLPDWCCTKKEQSCSTKKIDHETTKSLHKSKVIICKSKCIRNIGRSDPISFSQGSPAASVLSSSSDSDSSSSSSTSSSSAVDSLSDSDLTY